MLRKLFFWQRKKTHVLATEMIGAFATALHPEFREFAAKAVELAERVPEYEAEMAVLMFWHFAAGFLEHAVRDDDTRRAIIERLVDLIDTELLERNFFHS